MKTLVWLLRLAIFIVLLGLAIRNDSPVELRFFFDRSVQAPLSLIVLAAFAIGAVVGLSAAFATLVRQRIELGRLRRGAAAGDQIKD
jgi:lipopolysaccharide assembly protein A